MDKVIQLNSSHSKTVLAEVRDGSLVHIDETEIINKALGRKLKWIKVEDTTEKRGNYFQCLYKTTLPYPEALIALRAMSSERN